jgi:hypothetical protein
MDIRSSSKRGVVVEAPTNTMKAHVSRLNRTDKARSVRETTHTKWRQKVFTCMRIVLSTENRRTYWNKRCNQGATSKKINLTHGSIVTWTALYLQ